MNNSLRTALISLVATSTCLLAACGAPSDNESGKASSDQVVSGAVGNATPVASPQTGQAPGEHIKIEGLTRPTTDIERAGDVLAVRAGDQLILGSVDKLWTGSAKVLEIGSECGDITATGDTFVLPCPVPIEGGVGGGVIYLIDAKNPNLKNVRRADMKFTSAALTSTGEVIGGSSKEPDMWVFRGEDSSNKKKIATGRKADEIVTSQVEGTRDGVVFIEREKTVIQGVDFTNNRPGGALRMGIGVGSIAAGENGLFLAADTLGSQLGVYTDNDVLMLHQTISTDASPWAVAWDTKRKLAWIASNATNKIQAFALDSGVPELRGSLDSPANLRHMAFDQDGNLYAVADSGDGIHMVSAKDVSAVLKSS